MDVAEAIRTLRAVRRFADRPIDRPALDRILDAGRRAGSSKNRQERDFVLVRDRATLGELARVGPYAGHVAGAAAAVALVVPATPRPAILFDLGLAAQNMVLAAWAQGVGSCPATVYEPDLARRLLGYPDDRACPFLLSFGYPADPSDLSRPPQPGGRRPLRDVVHEETWGRHSL
ncbi:MAG TPA: nitroreductase family protein [Candidatus Limnocylindrales bacterium]|nr:nitroreductase family protein [Candidatus Limnocylindrales bacterium]